MLEGVFLKVLLLRHIFEMVLLRLRFSCKTWCGVAEKRSRDVLVNARETVDAACPL